MPNFDPTKHDNAMNPYTLSTEKQQNVMDAVNDSRLTSPPGDYFRIEFKNRSIDIPKLEVISKENANGKIIAIETIDYIKDLLQKES